MSDKRNPRKRSFSESWLEDERFKSWIQKVPSDESLFYCITCDKKMSCFSSHVARHANSASHKDKMKQNISDDDIKTKKMCNIKFQKEWLDIASFKPWLREVSNDKRAFFCTFCNKSFIGGLSNVYRHAFSDKHKELSEQQQQETNDEDITEESIPLKERRKLAEIRYAALIADRNIPFQTAKDILDFFQEIGKDLDVLQKMCLSRKKCTNIITNVLCPIETSRVVENIQNTKFSIFIDETSDITNEKWMTFLVRFVDSNTLDIRTQLVKLINIDAKSSNADKIFDAFKNEMWKLEIPFQNIIALSCDNASVMIGKYTSFKRKLEEMCKHLLTFTCPCHSTALVAHSACAKIPEYCKEFLKKISNFINSSPKRSAIYRDFSDSFSESHNILKLADTRWLSRHSCIARILESWDAIKHFLTDMILTEKSKPASDLMNVMQNYDLKAYFLFLEHILHYFNKFNAFFQSTETRIHLLQPKSVEFLTTICEYFLKPELLKNVCNIQFSQKENQKPLHDINLGVECEEYLEKFIKEGDTNMIHNYKHNVITTIRKNCLQFYVIAAEEINKRLPINDAFLSKLKVFEANIALSGNDRELSFNDVSFIAKTIGGFDENGLREEWFKLHEDFTERDKINFSNLNFDDTWKKILQTQNSINSINTVKYCNLKSLVNAIRSLPNSNADAERMFSVLTDLKSKKRNKLSVTSVNALCVLKSALKSRKETVLNMKITEKHLSFMSSKILYANNPPRIKSHVTIYAADAGPSTSK